MQSLRSGNFGAKRGGALFDIRLKPGSSRDRVVSAGQEGISLAVTAAPVDGKANEAMIRFLAKVLDVPKSAISIRKGATSRNKLVEIAGMTKAEAVTHLNGAIEG